jgi:hypothetical protein
MNGSPSGGGERRWSAHLLSVSCCLAGCGCLRDVPGGVLLGVHPSIVSTRRRAVPVAVLGVPLHGAMTLKGSAPVPVDSGVGWIRPRVRSG